MELVLQSLANFAGPTMFILAAGLAYRIGNPVKRPAPRPLRRTPM